MHTFGNSILGTLPEPLMLGIGYVSISSDNIQSYYITTLKKVQLIKLIWSTKLIWGVGGAHLHMIFRVRRDANEQTVLKSVRSKLCSVANLCSVQVN